MFVLKGDVHLQFDEFNRLPEPEDKEVVVLGDFGLNYFGDRRDILAKEKASKLCKKLYLVRGNHEIRPSDCNMSIKYDSEIKGYVYYQKDYPNIEYLMDGHIYIINDFTVLVIGGAYSVDKFYRLSNGWNWFENEQLSKTEMDYIERKIKNTHIDIVLSHTCPISWCPVDLFIPQLDQKTVDKTMEEWLEKLKDEFDWDYWFFGHFHEDRKIQDGVYMLKGFMEFPSKGE